MLLHDKGLGRDSETMGITVLQSWICLSYLSLIDTYLHCQGTKDPSHVEFVYSREQNISFPSPRKGVRKAFYLLCNYPTLYIRDSLFTIESL